MAWSTATDLGGGSNKTGADVVITTSAAAAVGDVVLVLCADHYSVSNIGPVVTDSAGNTYTTLKQQNDGASNETALVFGCVLTNALASGGTITYNPGPNVSATAARAVKFTGGTITMPDTAAGAGGSSTTPSAALTSTVAGALRVGVVAVNGPTTQGFTEDTSPAVTTLTRTGTSGAGATSNSTLNACYFIETSAGALTYNPTLGTSAPWAEIWLDLSPGAGAKAFDGKAGTASNLTVLSSAVTRPIAAKAGTASGARALAGATRAVAGNAGTASGATGTLTKIKTFAGNAGTASGAKSTTPMARARPVAGNAGTSSSAKSTVATSVTRGIAARAATASSATATRPAVTRSIAARAGTAGGATGTLTTVAGGTSKPLDGRAPTASSARATAGVARPVAANAATSSSARATSVGRVRPVAGNAGTASGGKVLSSAVARPIAARAGTADNAKVLVSAVTRPLLARAGTATGATATLVTTPPNVVALAGRAATSSSARAGLNRARPIAGRAGTASGASADLTRTVRPPVTLSGTANAASSARPSLGALRPFTVHAGAASSASAVKLTVVGAVPPPGLLGVFRAAVATVLDGLDPMTVTGALGDVREVVVTSLENLDDTWEVHPFPVDSLTPPAFMLEWSDPWTTPATHCRQTAYLEVICVAGRIEPDPGIDMLERMVEAALTAFNRAGMAHLATSAPRPFEIGGVPYLACRIQIQNTVNIGG